MCYDDKCYLIFETKDFGTCVTCRRPSLVMMVIFSYVGEHPLGDLFSEDRDPTG